jgi:hypothetical protein
LRDATGIDRARERLVIKAIVAVELFFIGGWQAKLKAESCVTMSA